MLVRFPLWGLIQLKPHQIWTRHPCSMKCSPRILMILSLYWVSFTVRASWLIHHQHCLGISFALNMRSSTCWMHWTLTNLRVLMKFLEKWSFQSINHKWDQVQHALLVPLAATEEPSRWIAMDVISLLPCSHSGKKYVLMVWDYVTCYLEGVPLHSMMSNMLWRSL